MRFLYTILAILAPLITTAQQQQAPQNTNTFGRWEIETESGMSGSVVIEFGLCHYSIISSFAAIQSNCQSVWYEGTNTLIIRPLNDVQGRNARAFTVPEYQPGPNNYSATQQQFSVGESTYAFQMTTFGNGWMKGHLLGSNGHDTVTLTRH